MHKFIRWATGDPLLLFVEITFVLLGLGGDDLGMEELEWEFVELPGREEPEDEEPEDEELEDEELEDEDGEHRPPDLGWWMRAMT
ncbi:MAG: hypothetical protein AAGF11_47600 [Myxococcota bacterium]